MNYGKLLLITAVLICSISYSADAQQSSERFRISGIVLEVPAESAEQSGQTGQRNNAERQGRGGGQRPGGGRMPGNPISGVNISLLAASDSSLVTGTASGEFGLFVLERIPNGEYILAATFVGYTTQLIPVSVSGQDIPRMVIRMTEGAQMLQELQISALMPRVEVRGDTTAFNADAFQVNQDATAEDLVRRMPGFVVQDGQLQAQGEQVRRVLLDGEEFFGDDATVALRNLPADIIGSIELFDRRSDQSRFTGFDDGNEERTINIVTRTGRLNGQFGRGTLSGGSNDRYMASGNFNIFNGPRRISILGMTNNVNQQNFTGADLEGVAAASQNQGGRGGMMGGGRWGGNPATRNFLTGSQSGINTTHSFGVNYIDRIGSTRINSSYFFSAGDNTTNQTTNRQFITDADAGQSYNENVISDRSSYNHRFNARIEYELNNRNSFVFTPSATWLKADTQQFQDGITFQNGSNLNALLNSQTSDDLSYTINNNALWRYQFEQRGRTLSVNVRNNVNNRTGNQIQNTASSFFADDDGLSTRIDRITNQSTEAETRSWGTSADIQYTEPLRENIQALVRFRPSFDETDSERLIFDVNPGSSGLGILNPDLTSQFISRTWAHQAGTGLRYRKDALNLNADVNYEYTVLKGDQTFPLTADTRNIYQNLVGSLNLRYMFSRTANVNVNYRTFTRNPTVSQLQDVVDNSNPLLLRGGNPELDQQYAHSVSVRYRTANIDNGTSWFGVVSYTLTQNTIGNTTLIATADTLVAPGVVLGPGGRFTRPENIGSSHSVRSFFNHSRALPVIKSNANFNGGVSYSLQPTVNNEIRNEARNIGLNAGTSLSSNISPNVDFNISYRGNYNIVDNASALGINNNYYTGNALIRLNMIPWGKLVVASDLNFTHYEGLDEAFVETSIYWNAALGYKFGKNNAAEIRLTVFDILAQNNAINRIVNDAFVDDQRSNVITRFALMSFSYNFRNTQTARR